MLIDYLGSMSGFARLGPKMSKGLSRLAPQKWTGPAKAWWDVLPLPDQDYYSGTWDQMFLAIRAQFMDNNWRRDRNQEFEEMIFRQKGHEKESPLDYIQCQLRYNHFLFPDATDGPGVVHRILYKQPVAWSTHLNMLDCPTVFELQSTAKHMSEALVSAYLTTSYTSQLIEGTKTLTSSSLSYYRKRRANLVELMKANPSNED